MALAGDAAGVPSTTVMTELHGRVRERLRAQARASGGSRAFEDPALFADVEALLHAAAGTSDSAKLILPELLGDPDTWRLTTSHALPVAPQRKGAASVLIFLKRRVLMPVLRWLYEYSRDNFERQRRDQPGAVRLRAGAGRRNGAAAPRDPCASVAAASGPRRSADRREARVRRPAVRRRHRRRLRRALPRAGRTAVRAPRHHRPDHLREGLRHVGERVSCRASVENGVRVLRFPVARPRRIKVFADLSDEVFDGGAPPERQEEWFRENGPESPALLDHLRAHGRDFDLVLFWTFRYFQSYFGLPLVADRCGARPDRRGRRRHRSRRAAAILRQARRLPLPDAGRRGAGLEPRVPPASARRRSSASGSSRFRSAAVAGAARSASDSRRSTCSISAAWIGTRDATLCSRTSRSTPSRARTSRSSWPDRPRCRSRSIRRFARSATCPTKCARRSLPTRGRSSSPPGTRASASSCSRRGTTAFRRWSTDAARCWQGRCTRANGGLYYMFPAEFDEAADYPARSSSPSAMRSAVRGWRTSIASTAGPPCWRGSNRCCRRCDRRVSSTASSALDSVEPVRPHLQREPAGIGRTGNHIQKLLERLCEIRGRRHGRAVRVRVVCAHDDSSRLPDRVRVAASPDLREGARPGQIS